MKVTEIHILRPALALEIGEPQAIILERISAYLKGTAHTLKGEEGKWIYNSIASWHEQHFPHWSKSKIYRTIKSLEEKNLIISKKVDFSKGQHTKWYSINEDEYNKLIAKVASNTANTHNSTKIQVPDQNDLPSLQNDKINIVTESINTERFSSNEEKSIINAIEIQVRIKEEDFNFTFEVNKENQLNYKQKDLKQSSQIARKINTDKGVEEYLDKTIRDIIGDEMHHVYEQMIEKRINNRIDEKIEERLREITKSLIDKKKHKKASQEDFGDSGFNVISKVSQAQPPLEAVLNQPNNLENTIGTSLVTPPVKIITKEPANTEFKGLIGVEAGVSAKIAAQMVDLWNKVFEHSVNPIKAYASKNNQEVLLTLYKTIFNSDLNNWREYALKVNSSQFLMGEKETKNNFKAVFSWLIKPETVEKILSGEYGVGDRELDMNNKARNAEIKKEQKVSELENRVTNNLKENLNEFKEYEEFRSYVEEEGYENDNDKYKLGVVLRHIPKRNFLHSEEYKVMRDRLFESYLMKKHTDQSRLEIRDKLRSAVNSPSDESRFIVTQEMPRQVDCIEENTKTQLHGKDANVNYQNKLTTIKTTKYRESKNGIHYSKLSEKQDLEINKSLN